MKIKCTKIGSTILVYEKEALDSNQNGDQTFRPIVISAHAISAHCKKPFRPIVISAQNRLCHFGPRNFSTKTISAHKNSSPAFSAHAQFLLCLFGPCLFGPCHFGPLPFRFNFYHAFSAHAFSAHAISAQRR